MTTNYKTYALIGNFCWPERGVLIFMQTKELSLQVEMKNFTCDP